MAPKLTTSRIQCESFNFVSSSTHAFTSDCRFFIFLAANLLHRVIVVTTRGMPPCTFVPPDLNRASADSADVW